MFKRNYVLIGASLVLLLAIAAGAWILFFNEPQQTSPYIQLKTNTDFIKAQTAFTAGKWEESISLYKQAAAKTEDTDQKLSIYYYLAAAENITGKYIEAVQLLKQVAAAETLPDETRAYALQYMGIMTLNLSNPAAHDEIMAEIFKDSPYIEMRVQGDDALSSRHLFEYASSFYPLGIAEGNIAAWYAGYLMYNNISTTTEPGLSNIRLIKEKLANADTDIARTENIASRSLIPQIYARKAETIEFLARIGVVKNEEAVKTYMEALQTYQTYNSLAGDDWFLRFVYANFLAYTYGQSRKNDIAIIVKPLYSDPAYTHLTQPFFTTLSQVRVTKTPVTALEANASKARNIGKLDSDFKNFLVSLGWSKNNF